MTSYCTKAAVLAAFTLAAASAHAGDSFSNFTYGVFDNSSGTRIFNVRKHAVIEDVNIAISLAKCDDPPLGPEGGGCLARGDAFPQEVVLSLTSPGGTTVRLVDAGTYDDGFNRFTITFDDEATRKVGGMLAGGPFRPVGSLSDFDGRDMFGNWTLNIADTGAENPLEVWWARIDINGGTPPVPLPEPGTTGMLLLGLAGMFAIRGRVRNRLLSGSFTRDC